MCRHSIIAGLLILLVLPSLGHAQFPATRPYDGIQAGLDAYRLAEERRRGDLQQQLDVNEGLRVWSGSPPLYGDTIWYRDAAGFGPVIAPEAWYLRGSTYGFGYGVANYRQPVGRWEGQTGPNRWESHPVYDPPLTPYRPSPPVDSPWLDRTPYATPRPAANGWSDGYSGTDDMALPSPAPISPAFERRKSVPPEETIERPTDAFDMPRRARASAESIAPPPATPAAPRRVREF